LFVFECFDMPTKRSQPAQRKLRADAQRNRERILEVAKEALTRSGANASLDDIAKQARVGPGTLVSPLSYARGASTGGLSV
jgi:AcrR family transcriptional regulator